jgi:hypothetical protein
MVGPIQPIEGDSLDIREVFNPPVTKSEFFATAQFFSSHMTVSAAANKAIHAFVTHHSVNSVFGEPDGLTPVQARCHLSTAVKNRWLLPALAISFFQSSN